jgi:hypothetical protein
MLKLVGGAGALLLLALLVNDRNGWKSKAEFRQSQLVAEQQAHAATVSSYRAAAERARREDAENLARVTARQSTINERTAHDFESRIAAARARADELRSKHSARADSGDRGDSPLPRVPAASGGAAQGAREDGLSLSDRQIATEQAIQLDELINWVKAQSVVRTDAN